MYTYIRNIYRYVLPLLSFSILSLLGIREWLQGINSTTLTGGCVRIGAGLTLAFLFWLAGEWTSSRWDNLAVERIRESKYPIAEFAAHMVGAVGYVMGSFFLAFLCIATFFPMDFVWIISISILLTLLLAIPAVTRIIIVFQKVKQPGR